MSDSVRQSVSSQQFIHCSVVRCSVAEKPFPSSFVVRRSSFVVRRSSFVVRRSSFVVVVVDSVELSGHTMCTRVCGMGRHGGMRVGGRRSDDVGGCGR